MASDLGAVSGPLITGLIADAFGFGPAFVVTGAVLVFALLTWLGSGDAAVKRRVVPVRG